MANSEGWISMGPMLNQRAAPWTLRPTTSTASSAAIVTP